MNRRTNLIAFAILLLISLSASAQPRSENIEQVGRIYHHWEAWASSVSGDIACVTGVGGLLVIDLSDPAQPRSVALRDGRGGHGYSEAVYYDGRFAYYGASHNYYLELLDLQDPAHPELISDINIDAPIYDLYVIDSLIYVSGYYGLTIIKRSEQNELELVSRFGIPSFFDAEVVVNGGIAYYFNEICITVIDVTDPSNPDSLTVYDLDRSIESLAISEGRLVLALEFDNIKICDISDPLNISEIGQIPVVGFCYEVVANGNRIYFIDGDLRAYDITRPDEPIQLGDIDSHAISLAVRDSIVLMNSADLGLQVVNYSDSLNPCLIGSIVPDGRILDVKVRDQIAYVAAGDSGLRIVDVGLPENPAEIGSLATWDELTGVEISGDKAVVKDWRSIRLIDIADPHHPVQIDQIASEYSDIAFRGNLVYLVDGSQGFKLLDWSDPDNPNVIAQLPELKASAIALSDTLAYLADSRGLRVIDISEPRNPEQVSFTAAPGSDWENSPDVVCSGSVVVLSNSNEFLHLFDVSNPRSPRRRQWQEEFGSIVSMDIENNLLYLATERNGIQVVDVSDLAHPQQVGFHETTGSVQNLDYSDGIIFLADQSNLGLYHYVFDGVSDPGSGVAPVDFALSNPYPNPFNSTTLIRFALPRPMHLRLAVFDLSGKEVALLAEGRTDAGRHEFIWDASTFPSGLYLLRLDSPEFYSSRKLVLVR